MSIRTPLKRKDVEKRLIDLSGWKPNVEYTAVSKSFKFPNFLNGLAFVAKIAVYAEVLEHHPDIELKYGEVKVKLSTHDAGGLTKKDFELVEKIDGLKV